MSVNGTESSFSYIKDVFAAGYSAIFIRVQPGISNAPVTASSDRKPAPALFNLLPIFRL